MSAEKEVELIKLMKLDLYPVFYYITKAGV